MSPARHVRWSRVPWSTIAPARSNTFINSAERDQTAASSAVTRVIDDEMTWGRTVTIRLRSSPEASNRKNSALRAIAAASARFRTGPSDEIVCPNNSTMTNTINAKVAAHGGTTATMRGRREGRGLFILEPLEPMAQHDRTSGVLHD